jgi:hypothetical protein
MHDHAVKLEIDREVDALLGTAVNSFTVRVGDRCAERLTQDEALWVTAQFLMTGECHGYLKTREEQEAFERLMRGGTALTVINGQGSVS